MTKKQWELSTGISTKSDLERALHEEIARATPYLRGDIIEILDGQGHVLVLLEDHRALFNDISIEVVSRQLRERAPVGVRISLIAFHPDADVEVLPAVLAAYELGGVKSVRTFLGLKGDGRFALVVRASE